MNIWRYHPLRKDIENILYQKHEEINKIYGNKDYLASYLQYKKSKHTKIPFYTKKDLEDFFNMKQKIKRKFYFDAKKLAKKIAYFFNFEERVFLEIPLEIWAMIKILLPNEFIYYQNMLLDKAYFNQYLLHQITNKPIKDLSSLWSLLLKDPKFLSKYHLNQHIIDKDKNMFFNNHKSYLKWFIKEHRLIDIKTDFERLALLKKQSQRDLLCFLERNNDILLKISSTKFIEYKKHDQLNLIANQIQLIVNEQSIFKFKTIREELLKSPFATFIETNYPGDSLYYLMKMKYYNEFSFDDGNRKTIAPKDQENDSLQAYLEKTFPIGYGKIDLQTLWKAFSETIHINSQLIWGNKWYFSKQNQQIIMTDFKSYFSKNQVMNDVAVIKQHVSKVTRFYLENLKIYTKIARHIKGIVLIRNVFINTDLKDFKDELEKDTLIKFFYPLIKESGINNFLEIIKNPLTNQDFYNKSRILQILECLQAFKILKIFLIYVLEKHSQTTSLVEKIYELIR